MKTRCRLRTVAAPNAPIPVHGRLSAFAVKEKLLLEEVFERSARIVRAGRARWCRRGWVLRIIHRRRILFNRHSKFKKRAVILRILLRNPLRNGLCAFELPSRIEMHALFAAVQCGLAFRAFSVHVESRRQHRSATRASRPHYRADHPRCPRPKHVLLLRTWFAGRSFASLLFFVFRLAFGLASAPASREAR